MSTKSMNTLEQLGKTGLQSMYPGKVKISVGMATCGLATGAQDVFDQLEKSIAGTNLDAVLSRTGCLGFCQREPLVDVYIPGKPRLTFADMTAPRAVELVDGLNKGEFPREYVLCKYGAETLLDEEFKKYQQDAGLSDVPLYEEIPFFAKQKKIALRNCGYIDPGSLEEYAARSGYRSLQRALSEMSPEDVIDEIKKSGLRGRGGGGFPTGLKWEFTRKAKGDSKYIICNADEGDPGAYMDRSVLEGDPHTVIEGMIIGGYAIGASKGVIYIRTEYPLAIGRLKIALAQAASAGFLGANICGSGFSFDIEIREGSGAFVCGEETSLIHSIEGVSPEPRNKPPFPAESGLWESPTNINNVETWANIPAIVEKGSAWYAGIGTEKSKGTKVFSLVGKVTNTGLVEVPMGITLREIIFEVGGGIPDGKEFKAVQTGGPSGGCIPVSLIDLPVDYEQLAEAGSIMGSGGMVVMDGDTCVVDIAKYFLEFTNDESCGKCTSCRDGSELMLNTLSRITEGDGRPEDIDFLIELGEAVKDASQCGLGQSLPNPVLSTLKYFRHEYEAHILKKKCEAFVCKDLVGAPCATACPVGTEAWRYVAHIARGEMDSAYRAIREPNPFPSVCARVCHHPCEMRCTAGTSGSTPVAIRTLKRFITDTVEPSTYRLARKAARKNAPKVAVVGAGPAGLSAAHHLSMRGYSVTLLESDPEPGGMLMSCIPAYRLPREVLRKEIASLLDTNIQLKCNVALGRDIGLDDLFEEGHKAVFVAIGASKSKLLGLDGETVEGCYPAMKFLREFNLEGKNLAQGHVGVIGGGNSAVDSARIALRQKGVKDVTIIYRRGHDEMPAFEEEIEGAVQEGVKLETLVSPVELLSENGRLTGIKCIRNRLGDVDSSGRRRPVAVPGTEFTLPLDTLVVAISEDVNSGGIVEMGVETASGGRLVVSEDTLATNREGVFAGGDVVTGPNTVVDAVAAGKRAAVVIDKYLRGESMEPDFTPRLPEFYVEPVEISPEEAEQAVRVESPVVSPDERKKGLCEIEKTISEEAAIQEARRCLRCDLQFTQTEEELEYPSVGGNAV